MVFTGYIEKHKSDIRLNEADFNDEDFDYVVEVREGDKICFGSTVVRNTSPIGKGLSPLQKRTAPEIFKTAPGYYFKESTQYKVGSRAGIGPLASKTPRFKPQALFMPPSPGRYDTRFVWESGKQCIVPFGIGAKLRQTKVNDVPSPITYDIRKTSKCRRTRFMYNFGKPTMIETVEIICVVKPVDTCIKCNTLCEGDYWHQEYTTFLCQLCWDEEKATGEIYDRNELRLFKKIRNCSFMHNHEETTAAIRILPMNKIKKKIRLENYLDLYIKC